MCCVIEALTSFLRAPFSSSSNTLTVVGFLVVLYAAAQVVLFVWKNFRMFFLARYFPSHFGPNLRAMGSWGVVTGASDGIGKEYAIQLARNHQLNVVLISRTMSKLEKVAAEIKSYSPQTQVKCVAVDFSDEWSIYDKIEAELAGLDIAILVNNVGDVGPTEEFQYFYKNKRSQNFINTIRINCISTTFMTQIVLPRLMEKKKGVIVNVASAAGTQYGMPYNAVYSGTKAYSILFNRTMYLECLGSGVTFQTLLPYMVATKMIGSPKPSITQIDAETYAKSAIASIGLAFETNGNFIHEMTNTLLKPVMTFFPDWFIRNATMSFCDTIQKDMRELARKANNDAIGQHAKSN